MKTFFSVAVINRKHSQERCHMMIVPTQRSLCSVKGRDQCCMPAPHLAPLVNKAQAVLVLWYLCLRAEKFWWHLSLMMHSICACSRTDSWVQELWTATDITITASRLGISLLVTASATALSRDRGVCLMHTVLPLVVPHSTEGLVYGCAGKVCRAVLI